MRNHGFILLAVLFSLVCSVGMARGQKPAASWKAEWEQVLRRGNAEGKLVIAGAPGGLYRQAMQKFTQSYPEIKMEYTGISGREFAPKLSTERRANLYLWDVHIGGAGTAINVLKQAGVLEPLRPALILPEVLDDKVWFGGLESAFLDSEGKLIFAFEAEISPQVYVNRDVVPAAELNAIEQLTDQKWSNKISWNDPRVDGAGNGRAAFWLVAKGESFVRQLLQQKSTVTRDIRQQVEWLVRGTYPIAIGVGESDLLPFQKEGVGLNVLPLAMDTSAGGRLGSGFGTVMILNRSPNANAGKVFINWLLSMQGQTAWREVAGRNSRRVDVKNDPKTAPKVGVKYFDVDHEERVHLRKTAIQIANEYIK
jgi:iron(III) transport system substrate-binding protein